MDLQKANSILDLINKNTSQSHFMGRADKNRVNLIEAMLQVTLPESYKWFLLEYGHGGIGGTEIIGSGIANTPACVAVTEYFRGYGLPVNLVVIENVDEWIYCLDTSTMNQGECMVVDWDLIDGLGTMRFDTFLDYLLYSFSLSAGNKLSTNKPA